VQIWDRQWHSNTWNALNSPFEEKQVCILGFHVELSFYIGKCNESVIIQDMFRNGSFKDIVRVATTGKRWQSRILN
jgi:hypothetical protein